MDKITKTLISATLIIFLFLVIANVSAADLVVNKNTTHSDIDSWMKNSSTVKGNNLIFNTSKYDLTDTINVSKPVNIKSNVKTQINFNDNKNMFNVSASGITFSGLTLNHNGEGILQASALIFSNTSKSIINFNNMNFNLNNNLLMGIIASNWHGNVTNSVFKSNGNFNFMISALNWTGNIHNSKMSLYGLNYGIFVINWAGNLYNSEITSSKTSFGVFAEKWRGKISNMKVNIKGARSIGLLFNSSSKGSISKSNINVNKGMPILIPKSVKISSTKAKSSNFMENILIIGPRIYAEGYVSYINSKNLIYKFKVYNDGESKSKVSSLTLKYGKYKKTVKIKALKPGKSTVIKIIIPKSFKKSKKKVITTYINGAGAKSSSKAVPIK